MIGLLLQPSPTAAQNPESRWCRIKSASVPSRRRPVRHEANDAPPKSRRALMPPTRRSTPGPDDVRAYVLPAAARSAARPRCEPVGGEDKGADCSAGHQTGGPLMLGAANSEREDHRGREPGDCRAALGESGSIRCVHYLILRRAQPVGDSVRRCSRMTHKVGALGRPGRSALHCRR